MYGAGAAFFFLEPEPTQVGRSRSRSRLQDLGDLEPKPEPPKNVAAPQHWSKAKLFFGLELEPSKAKLFFGLELKPSKAKLFFLLEPEPSKAKLFLDWSRSRQRPSFFWTGACAGPELS